MVSQFHTDWKVVVTPAVPAVHSGPPQRLWDGISPCIRFCRKFTNGICVCAFLCPFYVGIIPIPQKDLKTLQFFLYFYFLEQSKCHKSPKFFWKNLFIQKPAFGGERTVVCVVCTVVFILFHQLRELWQCPLSWELTHMFAVRATKTFIKSHHHQYLFLQQTCCCCCCYTLDLGNLRVPMYPASTASQDQHLLYDSNRQ